MEQYSILGRIGEGAHGIVLKAKHIEVITNNDVTISVMGNIFGVVLTLTCIPMAVCIELLKSCLPQHIYKYGCRRVCV